MPLAGLEPTMQTSERPQTYALDRAATGTGMSYYQVYLMFGANYILLTLSAEGK